ncbi:MerR family transcriptional regulator [Prauserella sp. PE36]|uniref:helix-turn-helix domain-containing protein n=1 Tax=Prauserella sp. PE36 TaxID=1504709 RepID=UPI000DE41311|nr:MerR family transcriptional regulator [Prauserella sp. PE36]RBM15246.1 MerR family transcriptional regulator [Prauserella sp. PE36]
MPSKLVTTGEAAKEIGVSRQTLSEWAKDGVVKPKYRTPGGHARWDVEDLLRQLDERHDQG